MLSVQIVRERLLEPLFDGAVMLGPVVDLLLGKMVINIDGRLGDQGCQGGAYNEEIFCRELGLPRAALAFLAESGMM